MGAPFGNKNAAKDYSPGDNARGGDHSHDRGSSSHQSAPAAKESVLAPAQHHVVHEKGDARAVASAQEAFALRGFKNPGSSQKVTPEKLAEARRKAEETNRLMGF